jgi:hypothetical protein
MAGGARPTFFEFKYCREPDEQNAAWTDALGEVLKDFYRLATCPAPAERLFVYVETAELRRYMDSVVQRYGLDLDTDVIVLRPDGVARLPMTAQRIIGSELAANRVEALRTAVDEMRRRGTGYAETTIRTMVTAHMCRNAPDNNAVTYDDLERVDRGLYRLVRD